MKVGLPFRLLNNEGTLLAYSKSDEDDREAKVTAAIASNIWAAYERIGKTAFQDENLNFLLVNCRVREIEEWIVTVCIFALFRKEKSEYLA